MLSLELTISDVVELLLQTSFFIHELFGFFFIEGIYRTKLNGCLLFASTNMRITSTL